MSGTFYTLTVGGLWFILCRLPGPDRFGQVIHSLFETGRVSLKDGKAGLWWTDDAEFAQGIVDGLNHG